MHDTAADDAGDLVQASASESLPADRPVRHRSPTERARFVAGYFGWCMTGDAIHAPDAVVALYVEDLAAALADLGWISDAGIHWELMPFAEQEAADALRAVQRDRGWDI